MMIPTVKSLRPRSGPPFHPYYSFVHAVDFYRRVTHTADEGGDWDTWRMGNLFRCETALTLCFYRGRPHLVVAV
jgi:hypothetical protein